MHWQTDSTNESVAEQRKPSKSVPEVLMTSASAFFSVAEKRYDEGSPGLQPSPSEGCSSAWSGAGSGVETSEGLVELRTSIMKSDDRIAARMVEQVLLRKKNGTWGRSGRRNKTE